ncbi:site-specific integrase [Acidisoma sp. L85]|uniref:site-specific integrase n=1 Tax=Acidisoma sp. L85 TaxID=1641850 RepID=UPI00131E5BD2|nr:site-specific integrase [Acidisoma sp. L85]
MTPLRQRMTEDMKLRGFSRHTQRAYVQYVAIFAQYFHKSPELLGPAKIRAFQLYLTQEPHLSPSSMAVAVTALRFLYKPPSSATGPSVPGPIQPASLSLLA